MTWICEGEVSVRSSRSASRKNVSRGRARRVGRREGELVEVVVDGLDLAVVDDLVAEPEERVLDHAPVSVVGWSVPSGRSSPGRDVDDVLREPAVELGAAELLPRASMAASSRSRTAFSVMPVSRSRTSRRASLSSLFRPRYSTRTCSSPRGRRGGGDRSEGVAARAPGRPWGERGYQRPRLRQRLEGPQRTIEVLRRRRRRARAGRRRPADADGLLVEPRGQRPASRSE